MATRITKPELEQALLASQRDNAALREQISVLRLQLSMAEQCIKDTSDQATEHIEALKAQLEATQLREAEMANALEHAAGLPRCTWVNTTHAEFMGMTREATQPTMPAPKTEWPSAPRKLPAHFVAAREAAMRLGRAVKVTA